MTVSAVAIAADGCVTQTLAVTRERTINEVQDWCERQQAAGYRVVALPFTPEVGVVVAEAEAEAVEGAGHG